MHFFFTFLNLNVKGAYNIQELNINILSSYGHQHIQNSMSESNAQKLTNV